MYKDKHIIYACKIIHAMLSRVLKSPGVSSSKSLSSHLIFVHIRTMRALPEQQGPSQQQTLLPAVSNNPSSQQGEADFGQVRLVACMICNLHQLDMFPNLCYHRNLHDTVRVN